MARNGGSLIDLQTRTVRGRDGILYPLDRIEVVGGCLHATRRVTETDRFDYLEAWLLPEHGWAVARFTLNGRAVAPEWYIETEIIEVDGPRWAVHDGYLDFFVFEGARYELQDMDELADGIAGGEITLDDALRVLQSAHRLAETLRGNGFSGIALLQEHGFSPPERELLEANAVTP